MISISTYAAMCLSYFVGCPVAGNAASVNHEHHRKKGASLNAWKKMRLEVQSYALHVANIAFFIFKVLCSGLVRASKYQ